MTNRFIPIKLLFFLGISFFSLGSCQTKLLTPIYPELTFQHLKPLKLNVARLVSTNAYKSPLKAPHVDHLFPVLPYKVLRRWADDRLHPVGKSNIARFTIIEASVIEILLEKKTGVVGLFTKDQSERYDAVLEAKLEIIDNEGVQRGFASARVFRSVTVREDFSINEREQIWFSLIEQLSTDINLELENKITQHLSQWLY